MFDELCSLLYMPVEKQRDLTRKLKRYRWDNLGPTEVSWTRLETQDLLLQRGLKTQVWGGIHCTEESCR